jgi:sugar transferase (PEP-CTERM system associated)
MPAPYDRRKKLVLLLGDFVLIALISYLSVYLRQRKYVNVPDYYTGAFTFTAFNYLVSFYIFDLYNINGRFRSMATFTWLIIAVTAGTAASAAMFYFFPSWKFGRGIFLIEIFLMTVAVFAWRVLYQEKIMAAIPAKRVVIVGSGHSGERIYEELSKRRDYSVKGFLDDDPAKKDLKIGEHAVLGDSSFIIQLCREKEIDAAVVALGSKGDNPALYQNLLQCKHCGVEVYDMPSLYELITGKLPVDMMRDKWIVYTRFEGMLKSFYTGKIKKLIDISVSLVGLVLSLPITVVTAVAIKLNSRGPVFFRQQRVGYQGEVFEVVKFRSMQMDAEEGGAVWASKYDPRVTRVGKIIRKLRIDEIPQMWNVLKGEMSFIGPRPERPEFLNELNTLIPYYSLRQSVKPGITGWAQINYPYGASVEDAFEKLQYDLFYIKNLSFFLDCMILLKTIRIVLFGRGAR